LSYRLQEKILVPELTTGPRMRGTTLEGGDAREARRLPITRIQSATDLLGLGRVRAFEF
jgi:hypothetical protein